MKILRYPTRSRRGRIPNDHRKEKGSRNCSGEREINRNCILPWREERKRKPSSFFVWMLCWEKRKNRQRSGKRKGKRARILRKGSNKAVNIPIAFYKFTRLPQARNWQGSCKLQSGKWRAAQARIPVHLG